MRDVLNFIDGSPVAAAASEWLDDVDPATGEKYARIASSEIGRASCRERV